MFQLSRNGDLLQVPQPNQQRSFRVPTPPRIFVPPPIVTPLNHNLDFIEKVKQFESTELAGADFLKTVTYDNFAARDHVLDWKYEERRTAQEILPFLFLGPVAAASDRVWLQEHGVTMVLAIRDTLTAQAMLLAPRVPKELGIPLVNIDIKGSPQLIAAFPRAIAAINAHLSERYEASQSQYQPTQQSQTAVPRVPGRVLVFCESGNERSAALVAAYIMAMYSINMVSAIQIVQSQRFCICMDDSLKWALQSYQDILAAKRDVASAANQANAGNKEDHNHSSSVSLHMQTDSATRERKRNVDDIYEEEIMVDASYNGSEVMGDTQRAGSAPFIS